MESSSVSGEREEEDCGSSQSGWTMYIATPTYQDDDENDSIDSNIADGNEKVSGHNDNDDDSLASDASSKWCKRRIAENDKVDDEDVNDEDNNESYGLHHPRPSRNVVQKESKVSRNV